MRLREAIRERRMRDTFGGYDWGDPIKLWTVKPPEPVHPPLSRAELVAEIEWFRDSGVSPDLTLQQLGVTAMAAEKRLERSGRKDLASFVRAARHKTEGEEAA